MQQYASLVKTSVFFLFMLLAFNCYAQHILVFDRDGSSKRIRFKVNDEIAVRADGAWLEGQIMNIDDSAITVAGNVVVVSRIKAIRYTGNSPGANLLKGVGAVFSIAGIALLGLRAINSVANNDYPVYSKEVLIVAGALILTRPIAHLLTTHRYKINEHHRLKVLDISIR